MMLNKLYGNNRNFNIVDRDGKGSVETQKTEMNNFKVQIHVIG